MFPPQGCESELIALDVSGQKDGGGYYKVQGYDFVFLTWLQNSRFNLLKSMGGCGSAGQQDRCD